MPVLPDDFDQTVPEGAVWLRFGNHERLVHQSMQGVRHPLPWQLGPGADRFDSFQVEGANEH